MTIYDQDFTQELSAMEASEKAQIQAVKDSIAESPVAVAEEQEEVQQPEMVADDAQQEPISDKELNFRALRDSNAKLKAEMEAEGARYQRELDDLRMQMQHQAPKQEKKGALDDQSDDELLTVGKYRQTVLEMQEQHQQELQALRMEQEETKARIQYSDYDEVMEKYSIPLLKENRDFARAFQASENKANFAYEIGKRELLMQQYKEQLDQLQLKQQNPAESQPSRNAQRMVDNARKPGTLSSARGGQPSLSKADYWATCSEADFQKEMEKNLAEV